MATRRSRLQIKPNLTPKDGKARPAPKIDVSLEVLKQKPVDKSNPQNNSKNENLESAVTNITTCLPPAKTESIAKPSPLKSPNQSGVISKPIVKTDISGVRGIRNRLPKAKPNIVPRGSPRHPTSPVRLISPEKVASPVSSTVKTDIRKRSVECELLEKKVQDENTPVPVNDETSSINSECISDTQSVTQSTLKPEKKSVKRHRNTSHRKFPENEPPDRQRMKMSDMIYWNPSNNPMKLTKNKKAIETSDTSVSKSSSPSVSTSSSPTKPTTKDGEEVADNSNDSTPVPQVTIGPDGSMIINEQSLIIETEKDTGSSPITTAPAIEDDDMFVNYNSFRNKGPTKTWLDNETARFYRALSALGTDFSLMSSLFPHRTRRELKNKFKREEKYNRKLVDTAIKERTPLNLENFESIETVLERDRIAREQKRKKRKRKKSADSSEENGKPQTSKSACDSEISENVPKKFKSDSAKCKSNGVKSKSESAKNKSKKSKANSKQPVASTKNSGTSLDNTEYAFSSGDEEPVPSRLPKLKKSPQFKEFRKTTSRKLRESCLSQPASEDEEDDNEDGEVDVTDSEDEMEIENTVVHKKLVFDSPSKTICSESQTLTPATQDPDNPILDSQISLFSDCSQEIPSESPPQLSSFTQTQTNTDEISESQETEVNELSPLKSQTEKDSPKHVKNLKCTRSSPRKSDAANPKNQSLSPQKQTVVTSSVKSPCKNVQISTNNSAILTQAAQKSNLVKFNSKNQEKAKELSPQNPKTVKSSVKSTEVSKDLSKPNEQFKQVKSGSKNFSPYKAKTKNINDVMTDDNENSIESVVTSRTSLEKEKQLASSSQTTSGTSLGKEKQVPNPSQPTSGTNPGEKKQVASSPQPASGTSPGKGEKVASSPQPASGTSPGKGEKVASSSQTTSGTRLLSRRKKFQPNLNISRKKTEKTTPKVVEEVLKDKPSPATNSSITAEAEPILSSIPVTETPKQVTDSEKLQLLCQSQPASDNDDDEDDEDDEVDVIDCDAFEDDNMPIMNIVKSEFEEVEPSIQEQTNVQEVLSVSAVQDTSCVQDTSTVQDVLNVQDITTLHSSIPEHIQLVLNAQEQSTVETETNSNPILKSPPPGLRNVKNKSKTTSISQKYLNQISSGKVDLTKTMTTVEADGSPHFVLPANVFPNLPFTQGEDKMQMVLVPETKDGNTIYHVYMLPENEANKTSGASTEHEKVPVSS